MAEFPSGRTLEGFARVGLGSQVSRLQASDFVSRELAGLRSAGVLKPRPRCLDASGALEGWWNGNVEVVGASQRRAVEALSSWA